MEDLSPPAEFRFQKYDRQELARCGTEFERKFRDFHALDWTHGVRDWFRNTAPLQGVRVYPGSGMGKGRKDEFIFDLCHTTYPIDSPGAAWPSQKWYERGFEHPLEIKLALESEWGDLVDVLDDACKLAVVRSSLKVMVFSSHWSGRTDLILSSLRKLRSCHNDSSPWLCIDVRDRPDRFSPEVWQINCELLTE